MSSICQLGLQQRHDDDSLAVSHMFDINSSTYEFIPELENMELKNILRVKISSILYYDNVNIFSSLKTTIVCNNDTYVNIMRWQILVFVHDCEYIYIIVFVDLYYLYRNTTHFIDKLIWHS